MTTMLQLEGRVKKLEKKMTEVRYALSLFPPLVNPLKWELKKPLDEQVLSFLIQQPKGKSVTTTQIAEALDLPNPSKTGRVYVWQSLKRIKKLAQRKRKNILTTDKQTWALNRDDFMFPGDLRREPQKL